jgi:NADH-quinone oxidoreductase subunit L
MDEAKHASGGKKAFDPQDMRFMGGLRKKLPVTFVSFMIAGGALAGLPLFSGFLSKDAILTGTIAWTALLSHGQLSFHVLIPTLGFIAALLTPFYIGRQIMLVFFGSSRLDQYLDHPSAVRRHELWLMKIPLLVLSALSLWFFYAFNPLDGSKGWLMQSLNIPGSVVPINGNVYAIIQETWHDWHQVTAFLSLSLVFTGFGLAYLMYRPDGQYAQKYLDFDAIPHSIFTKISHHNWYLDSIYHRLFVRPLHALSEACAWFDRNVIDSVVDNIGVFNVIIAKLTGWFDRTFVDGLVRFAAYITMQLGAAVRFNRSGKIQTYFIWTLVGLMIFIVWFSLH